MSKNYCLDNFLDIINFAKEYLEMEELNISNVCLQQDVEEKAIYISFIYNNKVYITCRKETEDGTDYTVIEDGTSIEDYKRIIKDFADKEIIYCL